MKKLYILGSGGFAREVAWLVTRINNRCLEWDLQGFISKNEIGKKIYQDYRVLGDDSFLLNQEGEFWVVCAVGVPSIRKKIVQQYENKPKVHFATLIDPSVLYSDDLQIGKGCILCAGNIVTVTVNIGNHVIVNLNSTIGHDVILRDYVTVYPGVSISGNVVIGENTELGTGTQIIQGKCIVPDSIVGAGGVVVKNISEKGTYIGIPVKKIK